MSKKYNTGKHSWKHGQKHYRQNSDWHSKLGPCPKCGTPTFDYGGNWRCLNIDCFNSANNPICSLGSRPSWWNTDIQVRLDGESWQAFREPFINLQESLSGFGNTPKEAVNELLKVEKDHELTKEEREFLIKYYKDNIQRHERLVEGYKIALKHIEES